MLDILAGLRSARPRWAIHLVVPGEGELARRARRAGVVVTVLPWGRQVAVVGDAMIATRGTLRVLVQAGLAVPSAIGVAVRMARLLRRIGPSIVHAHGFKMQLLGMWTRPRRVPLVLHLHDYMSSRRLMSRLLALRPPGRVRAIAISRSVRDDARTVLPATIGIDLVYNGIDARVWSPTGARLDLDRAAGLGVVTSDVVRIGLVATMARWKGHETFLQAIARLPADLPVRAYIVGGPIYESAGSQHALDELRALAGRLGIAERVGFTGFVAEPADAMRSLDIVVHASVRPEPFGRVIVEGMATERAVAARAYGGAAELFVAGEEALACHTDDPGELAGVLEQLVRDGALRSRLARNGRRRVEGQFTAERMTETITGMYEELLDQRRPNDRATP